MKGAKTALISPMRRKRRLRLARGRISSGHSHGCTDPTRRSHSRFDKLLLVPFCQERPPDLSIAAKQESQQAEPEVPLQRLSQHALPEPLLPRPFAEQASDRALQEPRNRQRDVEQVFVEQGDEVVLLSHDAVRDVVRVQALDGNAGVRAGAGGECGRVSGAQSGQAGDDGVPRDRLNVALRR